MHELIEELRLYHKEKARHLLDLENAVADLKEDNSQPKNMQRVRTCFEPFRCQAESAHHSNEELILLELRRTRAPIHRRVEELSSDHHAFDRICNRIWRGIADDSASSVDLASQIEHFISVYKDHAAGEDAIFFPMADKFLQDEHWLRVKKAWM